MAKKNDVNIKGSVVATITNNINKNGKIKGANKRETKNLKAMCPHHKITKKGKIRPTVTNDGNGKCYCSMCGHEFSTHLYTKDETKKIVGKFTGMLDQARFMNEAADLGKETAAYLARLSIETSHFGKTYGKIKKAVERTENVKKKKRGSNNNSGSGNSYGGWR